MTSKTKNNRFVKRVTSLILIFAIFIFTFGIYSLNASAKGLILGDVTGDGNINTLDSLSVLKHVAGITELDRIEFNCGDVTGDGKTNTLDSLSILKYSAGIIKLFANQKVTIFQKNANLTPGETFQIGLLSPFNSTIYYESENASIATVGKDGIISAISNGVTAIVITATITSGKDEIFTAQYKIDVSVDEFNKKEYIGIDVSTWQGEINWQKVKNSGVEFAILRSGYGWKIPGEDDYLSQKDNCFEANYAGAKSVQIPVGVYHYSYAKTPEEAIMEADYFLNIVKDKQFEYPVYYDLEDSSMSSLSKTQISNIALAFLTRLREHGYRAGIYANLHWLTNKIDMSPLQNFDIWLAQYNETADYNGDFQIWQHSSSGTVDGINSSVDLDISYVNYPKLIKESGLNGFKK